MKIFNLVFRSEPWSYLSQDEQGDQHAWEPVGHNSLTDWKKYSGIYKLRNLHTQTKLIKDCIKTGWANCVLLGAASTSDDELSPSVDDEECPNNREQPRLRFAISSDEGFAVEADSIEGKLNLYEI